MGVRKTSPIHNRIMPVMSHCNWYLIDGASRLAIDAGYSRSTVWRLLTGQLSPSFALAWAVTNALRRRMKAKLEISDLFSVDGQYRKPSFCKAAGCPGCYLEKAFAGKHFTYPASKPQAEDHSHHAISTNNQEEAS
jgi:hypothetical protein